MISSKLDSVLFLAIVLLFSTANAQKENLVEDCNNALHAMFKKNPDLKAKLDTSYGYAIFPEVKKGAIIIGGAGGYGIVYKEGEMTGTSKLSQASIGLQLGGQKYIELILFKNKQAYKTFADGKVKIEAQVSAVAISASESLDAPYQNGVLVYTMATKGLMFSAAVGGQKFSFEAID